VFPMCLVMVSRATGGRAGVVLEDIVGEVCK
jgi:hypothetical protein